MKKNTFNLKKMKFYFTILSLVLLSFSVSGQVQQNGTLYIGDTGIVYIGTLSSPYTFGPTASMVESTTTRTASYGRLYFPAGSTSIGAVDAHNLNGYVTTVGNADFIMPIGSGTVYAPLRVQPLDVSKEIDGAYVALGPTGTVDSSTLKAISTVEYWDMPNSADASAKITLSWRSASNLSTIPFLLGSGLTTAISDIVIAGYNTSSNKWERIESVVDGQNYFDNSNASSITSGSITSSNTVSLATYTKFTFGTSGTCSYATVTPSGNTCTWNGSSWTPSIPTIADIAVIAGGLAATQTETGAFKCYSLQLNSNITITNGLTVEVVDAVTGSFQVFLANTSSLIQRNSGAAVPNVTITKQNSIKSWDYVHFGLPVNSANSPISNVFTVYGKQFDKYYRYYTGNTGFGWSSTPLTNTPALGVGFIGRGTTTPYTTTDGATTIVISGAANNGDVIVNNMSNNTNNVGGNPFGWASLTLLGNPYPSGLDAAKFLDYNTGLDGSIYIWNSTSLYNGNGSNGAGDFVTYNSSGSVGNLGSSNFNGIISSAQGFRAYILPDQSGGNAVQTPTITFNNCMRAATTTANLFYRSNQQSVANEKDRFKLNISGNNTTSGQILIGYFPQATLGYDRGYDAIMMPGNGLKLYSFLTQTNTNLKLAINARPSFDLTDTVLFGFSKNGSNMETFNISISEKEGVFNSTNVDVFIHDKIDNTYHNLNTSDFVYSTNETSISDRFEIVYQSNLLSNDDFNAPEAQILLNKNTLIVKSLETISSIQIYDVTGRIIESYAIDAIDFNGLFLHESSIYIAKIYFKNGAILSKKLIHTKFN